jgi:hypothetical protein
MNIKGTAVHSIPEFIKKQFPGRYDEWIKALPAESQKHFKGMIFSSAWFPINEALVLPLRTTAKLFYNANYEKTAIAMGRFSADIALTGVYKFFIKLGSPKFLIERASSLMETYFQPSRMLISTAEKNNLSLQITEFPEPDEIIEWNIAGWIQRALEISGCNGVNVSIPSSLARKQPITEFYISWE